MYLLKVKEVGRLTPPTGAEGFHRPGNLLSQQVVLLK